MVKFDRDLYAPPCISMLGSTERLAINVFPVPSQISNDPMEGSVLIGSNQIILC